MDSKCYSHENRIVFKMFLENKYQHLLKQYFSYIRGCSRSDQCHNSGLIWEQKLIFFLSQAKFTLWLDAAPYMLGNDHAHILSAKEYPFGIHYCIQSYTSAHGGCHTAFHQPWMALLCYFSLFRSICPVSSPGILFYTQDE